MNKLEQLSVIGKYCNKISFNCEKKRINLNRNLKKMSSRAKRIEIKKQREMFYKKWFMFNLRRAIQLRNE